MVEIRCVALGVFLLISCFQLYVLHDFLSVPSLELDQTVTLAAAESSSMSNMDHVEGWRWPHVHTVRTYFMQNQGNLTSLARARLELFQVFCLPTMTAQTTQQFLWIIRTDPNLDKSIIKEMVDLLKDHPNFYLVGLNTQGDTFEQVRLDEIYTGNRTLYLNAKAAQKNLPVIETRLDADDGLHKDFLRDIQSRATQGLARDKLKWLMFCCQTAIVWHINPDEKYGSLSNTTEPFCLSAGLTVARSVGISETPDSDHYPLMNLTENLSKSESCGYDETSKCLVLLDDAKSSTGNFITIRARTPTSTGMRNVLKGRHAGGAAMMAWLKRVQDDYHVPRDGLKWLNKYLAEHVVDIARENLEGQCTPGNSCKV
jgi:hypothetical protein